MAGLIIILAFAAVIYSFVKGSAGKVGGKKQGYNTQSQQELNRFMDQTNQETQRFNDQMNQEEMQRNMDESMRQSERDSLDAMNQSMHSVDHNIPTNIF